MLTRCCVSRRDLGFGFFLRFHPSGADGGGCGGSDAVAVRAGRPGRDGGADGLWRGAVADRGVPRQWRCGGARCGGGGQAAPAGVGDVRAGRGPVGLMGVRRRALRRSGTAARGRGFGAAARDAIPDTRIRLRSGCASSRSSWTRSPPAPMSFWFAAARNYLDGSTCAKLERFFADPAAGLAAHGRAAAPAPLIGHD